MGNVNLKTTRKHLQCLLCPMVDGGLSYLVLATHEMYTWYVILSWCFVVHPLTRPCSERRVCNRKVGQCYYLFPFRRNAGELPWFLMEKWRCGYYLRGSLNRDVGSRELRSLR